jgi:hypothetical protein
MKKRKGEITTQQIVLLIILIISFAVILFLLIRLNLGRQTDQEICHNSIVMRSTSIADDAIPLKCSRVYICISKDGSCERMTDPDVKKVETEEEVYNVLAEEMATCWWMFGEGKIDYVGKDKFLKDNYCSICSQIGFDESVKDISGIGDEISKDKLYDYLSKTKMPDKEINYAEYFFGTNDIGRLKRTALKLEDGEDIVAGTFGTMDLERQHFVMMGITSEVTGRAWKMVVGGVVALGGLVTGYTWAGLIIGAVVVGAGEVTQGIEPEISAIIVEGNGIKNSFMAPTIQEANSNSLKKLNCYDVLTST